jgi:hypothetical protein
MRVAAVVSVLSDTSLDSCWHHQTVVRKLVREAEGKEVPIIVLILLFLALVPSVVAVASSTLHPPRPGAQNSHRICSALPSTGLHPRKPTCGRQHASSAGSKQTCNARRVIHETSLVPCRVEVPNYCRRDTPQPFSPHRLPIWDKTIITRTHNTRRHACGR